MKLTGKVAIVTGAGRGIGKEISLAFAREQATVVVVSRTLSELEETAENIRRRGLKVLPFKADTSKVEEVNEMVKVTLEHFHKLDVLVNNAGVLGPIGPLTDNNIDDWTETIKVNLIGTFLCCRAVLPFMITQRSGKIINLSGGGATGPRPFFSAYSSSKSAIVSLTSTLAEEVKTYNIQVNAIAPGAIYTKIHEQVLSAGLMAGYKELEFSKNLKLNQKSSIEKPANLAVFLASSQSDGLTGRLISAVWDDWEGMDEAKIRSIMTNEMYTLRRIDGVLFKKQINKMNVIKK